MNARKIIIAGAGLTGLTYALLLKKEGFDVEIYEKRPKSDLDKLDSVIYLLKKTLDILSPFIDSVVFNTAKPMAFVEGDNETLFRHEEHSCVNITDLLRALLKAAERENIPIHRECELISFSKTDSSFTHVEFLNKNNKKFSIDCDQLIIACGNRDVRTILENTHYNKPIELHATYAIGTRIPIERSISDFNNTSSLVALPEVDRLNFYASQLAALLYCETKSIGNFSVYLSSLSKFVMLSTYPPEQYNDLADPQNQVSFLQERLEKMQSRLRKKYPSMDFTWLQPMKDQINTENVGRTTAMAIVCLPDSRLLDQGVLLAGDAFFTTPFIFGSEFNENVQQVYFGVSDYLHKLDKVKSLTEYQAARDAYIDFLWKFILDNKFIKMPDLVGNTVTRNNRKVNISPLIGYPISKKKLEKLNAEDAPSWIRIPPHQQGGWLVKKVVHDKDVMGASQLGWFSPRTVKTSSQVSVTNKNRDAPEDKDSLQPKLF